ncbi:MAG TPA: tetratricopeptide repeat protein, partial [Blastocatellia bacterium]|nr:tetratricopeptide repeat protein [Blastocatellia bacterium]
KDFIGKRPKIDAREWQGEDIAGQSIAVYGEQGLGDIIQFSRYLPLLVQRGADVSFFTDVRMHRLLKSLHGRIELHGIRGTSKAVNTCCALLSLPYRFGTALSTIPAEVPYLRAEKERVARWKARLGDQGFAIGIAWQGNPRGDVGRSVALSEFLPLARVPGVRLISLQKHYGLEQLAKLPAGMEVEQLGSDFDDGPDAFIDTAAVMESLDLIITSDTSVAHLAGALGRPTWVTLRKIPEWRWLLYRSDSPWYPTMRLFRQETDGDWASVFSTIADELRRLLPRPDVHSQSAKKQPKSWAQPTSSPDIARIFENAVASYKAGSYEAAETACRHVLEVQADHFGGLHLLGVIAGKRGDHTEAVRRIDSALKIDPKVADAHHHRGRALMELSRHDEAVVSFDRAIALNPEFAPAFNSRGIALQHLKRVDEALLSFEKSIALKPDFAAAYNNRGILLKEQKRLDEAVAAYDKAVALRPDFADARTNRGACHLLLGRYGDGWADYDWRLKSAEFSGKGLDIAVPAWGGEPLKGRRIAVYGEQCFGDIIQFARYLPMLVQHG